MSQPASDQAASSSFKPFTKAERIQLLNDIDRSITQLLQSAGLALKTLTASQDDTSPAISDRREAFESASNSYLKTLQTVDVGLRRQIWGLEEANIIPAEKAKPKVRPGKDVFAGANAASAVEPATTEGGMGKLDIGFLNSRSGRVGRDMEAELWEKARAFLEGLENRKSNGERTNGEDIKDEEMVG